MLSTNVRSLAHAEGVVRSIAARADAEITPDMMRELADVEPLLKYAKLPLPKHRGYRRDTLADRGLVPSSSAHARRELDSVRRWIATTDLARSSSTTAAAVHGMVRGILSKADTDLGRPDLRQLAILAGLPDTLRPDYLTRRAALIERFDDRLQSTQHWETRSALRGLRRAALAHDVDLDPSATRASLTREAAHLLARPVDAMTAADVERLGVIASTGLDKRPHLPTYRTLAPERLADNRHTPAGNTMVRWEFQGLHEWGRRVDRPEAVLRAIQMGVPVGFAEAASVVAAHGAGDRGLKLADNMLHALAATDELSATEMRPMLRLAGDAARASTVGAGQDPLRASVVAAIERAIAGLDAPDSPGYVDYGEIGRARAGIELLERLAARSPEPESGPMVTW